MRRSHLQSRHPRRGQALLLAVLIMIFAALLSASFIAIVSVNLNQTARQTDKNRAVVSAQAGMNYVKRQLAYSNDGERWRPQVENVPPAAGTAEYGFYYSALDRAQGWAGQYVKFPDPRTPTGQNAGPQFLTRVERVPLTVPISNPEFDKAGAVKITVIGLSPDDPTAYSRSVAYFGGYRNAPIAQTMRTISNWDFATAQTFVASANPATGDGTGATPLLGVANAQTNFATLGTPFSIVVSNPRANIPARRAVVTLVTGTKPNFVFTLADPLGATTGTPLGVAAQANERVELAANIGGPAGIDFDNNPATAPTLFTTAPLTIADTSAVPLPNEVDGLRANGGLIWSGALSAAKLRPVSAAFNIATPLAPGTVWASGSIAADTSLTTASTMTIKDIGGTPTDTLKSSDGTGIFTTTTVPTRNQIVIDGWNRLAGMASNNGTRDVSDFTPPAIDSGQGVERYRNLTRFSKPNANSVTPAITPLLARHSLDGFGEGIYIDNIQDKEKKTGTGAIPVEMTQSELVQMWMSSSTTAANYERTGTPINSTDAAFVNASLEEQHLRGWVGPDEFRARGVEIELGNNSIIITRDARDDNRGTAVAAFGPVERKAWKKTVDGTPDTGVYRKVMAWPLNGVIFAEGNVRIRGNATFAPRSLTVVSMNNIYIEDSISAAPDDNADNNINTPVGQPRKILLLAKKNVVMNPTRALGRPDAQTTANGAQTVAIGTGQTLTVTEGLTFQIGDFVQASTIAAGIETPLVQGYVTAPPTATQITFTATLAGAVPDGTSVRTANPPVQSLVSTLAPTKNIAFNSVAGNTGIVQRRLNIPVSTSAASLANLRLAFNHQATRVGALAVGVTDPTIPPRTSPILFSNKAVFIAPPATTAPFLNNLATVLAEGEKKIRVDFTEPTVASDDFPGTVASNAAAPATPASETEARDATRNLNAIFLAMNASNHADPGPPPTTWNYAATNPGYATLPFFYLAGVGNRLDFPLVTNAGSAAIVSGPERRPNIRAAAYTVPLAASISIFSAGIKTAMSNESWNATLTPKRYDSANEFGFSPTYIDSGAPKVASEDVLTGDQSFYQNDPVASTVDSRRLNNPLNLGFNSIFLRQSDNLATPVSPTNYPDYRLNGLKLEEVATVVSSMDVSTISAINPARTFEVNAFIYAQTGSWFVIPGGFFDDRIKSVAGATAGTNIFLDVNNNGTFQAGESIPDGSTGNSYPDLNRNDVVDDFERYAITRYSRFNYQINFTGAIAENQTALVNDVGTGPTALKGSVASWMDKWATTKFDSAAVAPALPVTNNRIRYIFDPTVVLDLFEKDDPATAAVEPTDIGFRLPQTPEVFNLS